jgi:PQQ-like domain
MSTNYPKEAIKASSHFALGIAIGFSFVGCGDDTTTAQGTDASSDSASTPDGQTGTDASRVDASDGGTNKDTGGGDAADATTADAADASDGASTDASEGGTAGDAQAGVVGHVLVADQFNNRVIEIDRQGNIVWQFGDGTAVVSPTSIIAPNDSERLPNGLTLMAGTGVATGVGDPACDARDAGSIGCPDNRVMLVDSDGGIVWQYGVHGELNTPTFAGWLASGNVLIADQLNERIVEVSQDGGVVWQYGPRAGDAGSLLSNPNSAQRLDGGNTLIADESNMRVVEVQQDGGVAWEYAVPDAGQAAFASRLPSGNTLITDSSNNRILEVQPDGGIAWMYNTATAPDAAAPPQPTRAVRLANGHTLIANQFYHQVVEIDNSSPPAVVFTYGQLGVAGNGANQLNAPYDSKVIGDFTGLTPPQ